MLLVGVMVVKWRIWHVSGGGWHILMVILVGIVQFEVAWNLGSNIVWRMMMMVVVGIVVLVVCMMRMMGVTVVLLMMKIALIVYRVVVTVILTSSIRVVAILPITVLCRLVSIGSSGSVS
jgi:hypothetical protein